MFIIIQCVYENINIDDKIFMSIYSYYNMWYSNFRKLKRYLKSR